MSRIIFIFSIFLSAACGQHSNVSEKKKDLDCDTCLDEEEVEGKGGGNGMFGRRSYKGEKPDCDCDPNMDIGNKIPDSICGTYRSENFSTVLEIFPENRYQISEAYEMHFQMDSGRFYFNNGTLKILSNCYHESKELNDEGYGDIVLIGEKIALKKFCFYFKDKEGKLDLFKTLLRKGKHWTKDILVDSTGTGYAEVVGRNGKVIIAGCYEHDTLKEGRKYYYDKNNKLIKWTRIDAVLGDFIDSVEFSKPEDVEYAEEWLNR